MQVMAQLFATGGNYLLFPVFLLLVLFFIFKQLKHSLASKTLPLPPGPTPWPILGNIVHMGILLSHVALSNFAQTYGPIISLRLGTQHVIVGSSPSAATEILKTRDRILSARYVPQVVHLLQQNSIVHQLDGQKNAMTDGSTCVPCANLSSSQVKH